MASSTATATTAEMTRASRSRRLTDLDVGVCLLGKVIRRDLVGGDVLVVSGALGLLVEDARLGCLGTGRVLAQR